MDFDFEYGVEDYVNDDSSEWWVTLWAWRRSFTLRYHGRLRRHGGRHIHEA